MRQIYIAVSGRDEKNPGATVADGVMEIEDDADLLQAIRRKYPNAKSAEPHEKGSNVIIVREND